MSFIDDFKGIKKVRKKGKKKIKKVIGALFQATTKTGKMEMYRNKPPIAAKALTAGLQMLAGVTGGISILIILAVNLVRSFWGSVPSTAGFILMFAAMAGAVGLCVHGWRTLVLFYRYQGLAKELTGCSRMPVADLCRKLNRSLPEVSGDLYKLIHVGLLPENCLDLERKEIVLDPLSMEITLSAEEEKTFFQRQKKRSAIPFYLLGVIWLMYGLAFLLYGAPGLLGPVALSAAVYLVSRKIFPDSVWLTVAARPEIKPQPVDTGNVETDVFLQASGQHMSKLTALSMEIANEAVRAPLMELIVIAKDIFTFVQKHPERIRQSRQFMNYYLPMSIKLLSNYSELEKQSQHGENIRKTMKEIEDVMDTVVIAFKRELDSLFADKAIDISADIAVMKNIMDMDKPGQDKILQ